MKSCINIFSHCFKVPTSVVLGFLTNETYFLDNAWARRPFVQYVWAIMRHDIECNIIDVANQLFFANQGIVPELRVIMLPPTESIKAADFICVLEERQKIWYKMMTAPAGPQQFYNPAWKPSLSPYKLFLPSQSKVFFCYQSQQRVQRPECPAGLTYFVLVLLFSNLGGH